MYATAQPYVTDKLEEIEKAGLYKRERLIDGPQQAEIKVKTGESVLNLCANNYLGLANHPAIIAAARKALDDWGYGLASVRFICGTQTIHRELDLRRSLNEVPRDRERHLLAGGIERNLRWLRRASLGHAHVADAELERAGVITQGRGRITVHDPEALANYVY